MACLPLPALSCFLLQVIRFCWKEKKCHPQVLFYFHTIFTSSFHHGCFLPICTACLMLPLNNNWRQFVPVEHPRFWESLIMDLNMLKQITAVKTPRYATIQTGMPYSMSPLELENWEQNEVGPDRIISFLERRSCRPLPRVRGSPTTTFFWTS